MVEVKASLGVKFIAFGYRHAPDATNFIARQAARVAAPITRKALGREYRLGDARYNAVQYNYLAHGIEPASIRAARIETVRNYLGEFLRGFEAIMPIEADKRASWGVALVGGKTCQALEDRKSAIRDYFYRLPGDYSDKSYGRDLVSEALQIVSGRGISKDYSTLELTTRVNQCYDSLRDANLLSWFTDAINIPQEMRFYLFKSPADQTRSWPREVIIGPFHNP